MAAAFASLPCKVLWRLTAKEVPDQDAVAALNLGNNTKVPFCLPLHLLIQTIH
jgi:glucuronosyltransferase